MFHRSLYFPVMGTTFTDVSYQRPVAVNHYAASCPCRAVIRRHSIQPCLFHTASAADYMLLLRLVTFSLLYVVIRFPLLSVSFSQTFVLSLSYLYVYPVYRLYLRITIIPVFSSVRPRMPFSTDTDTPIFCCQPIPIPIRYRYASRAAVAQRD